MSKRLPVPSPGDQFYDLTIMQVCGKDAVGKYTAKCRCVCGAETVAAISDLHRGVKKSCGCRRSKACVARSTTHGMRETRLYSIWTNMHNRCYAPSCKSYQRYGGRGITICDRWKTDFANFALDMGDPPSDSHTLERRNNDLGYSLENCYWATRKEQGNNKSTNVRIEYDNRTQTLSEWADELGMKYHTLRTRFRKGWSVERAFTTPVKERD